METGINSPNEKLFDLIEQKDFVDLTLTEKEFVLQHISEKEYSSQRMVVKMAPAAFDEETVVIPFPLKTNPKKSESLLMQSIPLYQVLLVAAAIILLFLLVPLNATPTESAEPNYIVKHDTIQVEKLVHDTVFTVEEKYIPVEKIVYVNAATVVNYPKPEPRLLESVAGFNLPELEKENIINRGNSLSQESTAILIKDDLK